MSSWNLEIGLFAQTPSPPCGALESGLAAGRSKLLGQERWPTFHCKSSVPSTTMLCGSFHFLPRNLTSIRKPSSVQILELQSPASSCWLRHAATATPPNRKQRLNTSKSPRPQVTFNPKSRYHQFLRLPSWMAWMSLFLLLGSGQ